MHKYTLKDQTFLTAISLLFPNPARQTLLTRHRVSSSLELLSASATVMADALLAACYDDGFRL